MTNLSILHSIIQSYLQFIGDPHFACVAARAAHAHNQIKCFVANDMRSPEQDNAILQFIYDFVDDYRNQKTLYHSATVIFEKPDIDSEDLFDELLWKKLQHLSDLDAMQYAYDERVSCDPVSPHFSYSLKGEAFFVIGLHPANSRPMRRFRYATLVFNPHEQFDVLREQNHYESMKKTVRKRDMEYSGSINPMLDDFGRSSEARQYSGQYYDSSWRCPLHLSHGKNENNTAT